MRVVKAQYVKLQTVTSYIVLLYYSVIPVRRRLVFKILQQRTLFFMFYYVELGQIKTVILHSSQNLKPMIL